MRFQAGVEYKGKLYASATYINGLFLLDLNTEKITYIKAFSKEKNCYAIHRTAFLYKNEAWFIPQQGQYIAVVNLDTMHMEFIEPPFRKINKKAVSRINAVYYSGGIFGDQYLYLIPANIDALLILDLESRAVYPYYDVSTEDAYYLFGAYADGALYLTPYIGNSLLKIDLRTNKRFQYSWKYSPESFLDILCYKNSLWLTPYRSDNILCFDLNTEKTEEIPLKEIFDPECTYEQVQIYKNSIFFIPFQADAILEFHADNKEIRQIYLKQNWLEHGYNGFTKIFSKDNLILASRFKGLILIYEEALDGFRKIDLEIERNQLIYAIENSQNRNYKFEDFIYENMYFSHGCYQEKFWGLEGFLEQIDLGKYLKRNNEEKNGDSIWRRIRR